jgi:hypothetical protein
MNIGYLKEQFDSTDALPQNEPVSSKSPQKELDLRPPNSGRFFAFSIRNIIWAARNMCIEYSCLVRRRRNS